MPVRPTSLATMSAAIAGAVRATSPDDYAPSPTTLTFESGRQQMVSEGGCHTLVTGQGGLVSVHTTPEGRYVLFSGPQCRGSRIVASGEGSIEFSAPVQANSIVIG
ncbi:hypothetical protein J4H86_16955 [Spiractinospora alimapuensis]|nr:hypothetical protein J4H86_16955 [Spiractinospora alimapuensis]